jgi:hypothetical protein
MTARALHTWLPSDSDKLLIKAATDHTPAGVAAWRQWRESISLDDARHEAAMLLPAAYRNLSQLAMDDPELERLKGIYRHAWSRNQLIFRAGATAISVLHDAGIDVMALKGAALSISAYRDRGARQMVDFDLLVPRERVLDAIAALRAGGFQPHEAFPDPVRRVPVHHSTAFVAPNGQEIDLHWYALWQSSPDQDFWEATVPIEVDKVASKTLCPTDQLLQVCAHGAEWTPTGSLRWIVDSLVLLRADAGSIDWGRFDDQAIKRRLTATMLDALEYLRDDFGANVPTEALERLRAVRVPLTETVARRAARAPVSQRKILISQWDRYRRLKTLDPSAPRQSSFPAQLREAWSAPSYRAFTMHAVRRLFRIGG